MLFQPQQKIKPKPALKPNYAGTKPSNTVKESGKPSNAFRSRLGISKSKSDDSSKRNNRPFHRLPKLDKGKTGTTSNQNPNKLGNTVTRRKNKYANVTSSGYGKTNYKPSSKLKSTNPSANSTLTDKTIATSGGTYGFTSKNSFGEDSKPKTTKKVVNSASRKLASTRKEKTQQKLPVIR